MLFQLKARKNQRPGGSFPNPFNSADIFIKLRSDPRTKGFLDDPDYVSLIQQLQINPQLLGQKLQDPRILTTLSVLIGLGPMGEEEAMETEYTPSPPPKKPESKPEPKKEFEPDLPENKRLARDAKEKGNEFYKKKDFTNAIEYYNKAIEYDPTDITFYNNLAAVYFEQKNFEKCIELCEKGIEVGRENRADFKLIAKSLMRIGNAYKKMKNYHQAKVYYEKSMSEHRTPEIKTLLSQVERIIKEEELKAYIDPVKAEQEKEMGIDFVVSKLLLY